MTERRLDIVLLCGGVVDEFQRRVLATLLSENEAHRLVGCVVDGRPTPPAWQRLRRNLSRGRGGYVLVMALKRVRRRRAPTAGARELLEQSGVPTIETDDPHGDDTRAWIRARDPAVLVLLGGFGILKAPLLEIAPHGVLAYHHGDMRKYRGQPPAFWELYNGEETIGVTVQRLGLGVDLGTPIVEREFAIYADDRLGVVERRIFEGSTDMMAEAIRRLTDPTFLPRPLESVGRLYTLPNLRQWLALQMRACRRLLATYRRDADSTRQGSR